VIPANFDYHRPGSIDEAIALLDRFGDDGKALAGGHSLIPMMKLRLAQPAHLVDLQALDELRGISRDGGDIRLGALTTQEEILGSDLLASACPILAEAAALIADPQVRGCGTIGGNVANGDPGNDMPAIMMALGASYVLKGPGGERTVAANGFYNGFYDTEMADNELLTEIRIPTPPAGHGYSYQKMKRKVGDYAIAAAAVILVMEGGSCASASVTLTNLADTPVNAEAAAQALVGTAVDAGAIAQAADAAMAASDPASDLRGPADFRKHMARVMTARAIAEARSRAKGG
jgi:carbon-monoxide dehydrogenase medium subunit